MMFCTLTAVPARKPTKPTMKRKPLRKTVSTFLVPFMSSQKVMVWMTVGAIRASVDELAAPTNEMKRSSLGMAAAKPTERSI